MDEYKYKIVLNVVWYLIQTCKTKLEWNYKDKAYLLNLEKWLFSKEIKTDNIKVTHREYQ